MSEENLPGKTDEELAVCQSKWQPNSDGHILIEKEWQRRARIAQHELDVKLIKDQVKWMKFSAIVGVVAALAGVCLAAFLQHKFPPRQPKESKPPFQATTSALR